MSSSSSSHSSSSLSKYMKAPVFTSTLPKAWNKDRQMAKLHIKLPSLLNFHADQTTSKLFLRKQTARKVLKNVSRLKVEKNCRISPVQVRNMTSNCKHYAVQSNSQNQAPISLKMINKVVSKHLYTLDLSGVVQVSVRRSEIKSLFNLISSRRRLQNLKLDVNFSLHTLPADLIRRTFSTLQKLISLTINIPSLSKGNHAQESTSSLETILSSIKGLRNLNLKCCVTRTTCEELLSALETLTDLHKLGIFIETPERLSPGFYSLVAESLSKIKKLRLLEISLDSYINQRLSNAFFLPFSKMRTLESLVFIINKLSVNDNDMQALFKTLPNLCKLKKLHFESNTKSLSLSNEYISNFHEALTQLTQLESFTYYVNHLHSRHFSDIFRELPMFPQLRSLTLNLTISEGEHANVYFLSEFLKNAKQLRSLSLRINDEDINTSYTYQVPSEIFTILGEGFETISSLENFELSLGVIEDAALAKILLIVDKLTNLNCLKLNASFDDIAFQAFGNFCNYLQRNKRRFNHLQVLPKGYCLPNAALLTKLTKEINAGEV